MKEIKRSLRCAPNGYYIFYVNKNGNKWMYYLEATEKNIFILKAYHISPHTVNRKVAIVFMHAERSKMTLTSGDRDGILFEIDEGSYMLELAENI